MKIPRKGTMRLLALTKKLTEAERLELLTYIGELEKNEDRMYQSFARFAKELDWGAEDVHRDARPT